MYQKYFWGISQLFDVCGFDICRFNCINEGRRNEQSFSQLQFSQPAKQKKSNFRLAGVT